MPNTESNEGLSLEALLAAAQSMQKEDKASSAAADDRPAESGKSEEAPAPAQESSEGAAPAETAVEPAAASQEAAVEEKAPAAPAFDLAAALGYGSASRLTSPEPAEEASESKFDLAAALGYKSPETQEQEAAEAARSEAESKAEAVQEQALREAQQRARMREREERQKERCREREERAAQGEAVSVRAAHEPIPREQSPEKADRKAEKRDERQRSIRPSVGLGAQSVADANGKSIESYRSTKRDRSAQARPARPLNQEEVTEVAQAIAADAARTGSEKAAVETEREKTTQPVVPIDETPVEQPAETVIEATAFEAVAERIDQPAAPSGEPVIPSGAQPVPVSEPAVEIPAAEPRPQAPAPLPETEAPHAMKPVDFTSPEFASSIAAGAPEPLRMPAPGVKPPSVPHKVPVRTTEEIIKPVETPVHLGVISPEAARHEAEAKKKVQSNERKIVKKVRRFRVLGMLLLVIALVALAGAIFLFAVGSAQANESIETTAAEICENAGRTITYRYKAADSNGTLCPTTEVATFSQGDVLEQSVITMNTPDFETAAHTLANFKKQFEQSSYVDGRVDGSTVIFTLHLSNERIMKVTYTALLMTNTTGCEVII